MAKIQWNKTYPYLIAVVLFIVLSWAYFMPAFEGKVVEAHDTKTFLGMSQEVRDYKEKTGEHALWTNSMFGGMPTFQIAGAGKPTVLTALHNALNYFPRPVSFAFLYLLCGFLLLLSFRVKPWLSMIGSVLLAFASYNFIIIAAGHNTKAIAIAYIMPLIGSIVLAYNGKRLLGALLTAVSLGLAIAANHFQILYYAMFIIGIFFVVELIYVIKEKQISDFLKTTGLLIVAAVLAAGMNAPALMTTYEYSKYTMRGESNGLTTVVDNQSAQHGLSAEYITQWSYDIDETMTLLIPDFKGGASGGALDLNSNTANKLRSMGVSELQIEQFIQQMPLYWGTQPITSGPVYFGAAVVLLFILGLFVVKGRYKWWLLAVTILSILLSWGKNFMPFTEFFINYVPMYNSFRTVSMTLVMAGIAMPLLGILALKQIFSGEINKEKALKYLQYSTGIVGGICLIFWWFPSLAGNFISASDAQFSGQYEFLKITLPLDRKDMLSGDALRSLILVLLCAVTLYFTIKGKLKEVFAIAILGVLFLFDLWQVDKRYLNDNHFTEKEMMTQPYLPTAADKAILQDKSDYRVLNLTVSTFNDSGTSYFHKSIGGYHGAKLRRYQELITAHIQNEMLRFSKVRTEHDLDSVFRHLPVLNMLNTKYVIFSKDFAATNPYANGNAWLVEKINIAQNADEEIMLVGNIDTKKELVIDKEFESKVFAPVPDSTAHIELLTYAPNALKYHFSSPTDQVAVFSEIYYPKGWNVYIDGKKTDYFRANYLLRAMSLKAGDYDVEFRFEPAVVSISNTIAITSSVLLVLLLAGVIFRKKLTRKQVDK